MQTEANSSLKKASTTAARAVVTSAVGRRVKRIFDLAVTPPPKSDPDPGNPVPFSIRKDLTKYRIGFYIALAALIALTITTPRTYLFEPITGVFRPEQISTGIIFLVFLLFSHWSVTGSDPGYLEIDVAVRLGEEHAQHEEIHNRQVDGFTGLSKIPSAELVISSPSSRNLAQKRRVLKKSPQKIHSRPYTRSDEENQKGEAREHNGSEELDEKADDSDDDLESSKLIGRGGDEDDGDDDEDVDDDEPNEAVDMNLSGIPTQQLPTRARFCRKSRRVVATYDHHCRVLNTTIGERNRARFWFLLLWSTCGICWLLSVVHSGFRNSSASVGAWMERNGQALVSAIICWAIFIVCAGLFVFHTFLMLANVTTYEFMRADKVSYLANTRDFDLPFSLGLIGNIKFYFSSDSSVLSASNLLLGKKIEWKPNLWTKPVATTIVDRNSAEVCKNLWENKYWSCC